MKISWESMYSIISSHVVSDQRLQCDTAMIGEHHFICLC